MTTLTRERFTLASPKRALPTRIVNEATQPESRLALRVGMIALATLEALVGCSLSAETSLSRKNGGERALYDSSVPKYR